MFTVLLPQPIADPDPDPDTGPGLRPTLALSGLLAEVRSQPRLKPEA